MTLTKPQLKEKLATAGIAFTAEMTVAQLTALLPEEEEKADDTTVVAPVGEADKTEVTVPVKPVAAPVEQIVYVNNEKLNRAKAIILLVTGAKAPANNSEIDRVEHYERQFQVASVDPKSPGALRFAYETLLGGLVRTPVEQTDADKKAAASKAKMKKNQIETDK